ELSADLGGVLAEPRRRPPDRAGCRRRPDWKVEHARGAVSRLLDRRHQSEMFHLRVFEHLVELIDRSGGHLLDLEPCDPSGRGLPRQRLLDPRLELVVMGDARVVGPELRIARQRLVAECPAEARVLPGVPVSAMMPLMPWAIVL